jgi:hypothetical protein
MGGNCSAAFSSWTIGCGDADGFFALAGEGLALFIFIIDYN